VTAKEVMGRRKKKRRRTPAAKAKDKGKKALSLPAPKGCQARFILVYWDDVRKKKEGSKKNLWQEKRWRKTSRGSTPARF